MQGRLRRSPINTAFWSDIMNYSFTTTVTEIEQEVEYKKTFTTEILGVPVRAEVPMEIKAECERLLCKEYRTNDENDYLHYNYWVNVFYKNERHGYHGINDIWTYSARELPELSLLHDWIYEILGKRKPAAPNEIHTIKVWEEKGVIYAQGRFSLIEIELSFKTRGYVLSFSLKEVFRWKERASYNTKNNKSDFPYYYSIAEQKIIEWGRSLFDERKRKKNKG